MPIRNLSPSEAHARQRGGAVLIDVRAAHERALGMAESRAAAAEAMATEIAIKEIIEAM